MREIAGYSCGFDVRSDRATPIDWYWLTGPKCRLSKEQGSEWTEKNWHSNHCPSSFRSGHGEAFHLTVKRLGGILAALVYHACGPTNLATPMATTCLRAGVPRVADRDVIDNCVVFEINFGALAGGDADHETQT